MTRYPTFIWSPVKSMSYMGYPENGNAPVWHCQTQVWTIAKAKALDSKVWTTAKAKALDSKVWTPEIRQ